MAAEKRQSLTVGALWILTAKVLAFGCSVVLPLLLVRRLNQYEFGLYKQAFLVVGTATTVLPLGFVMSAFYFLPREPDRHPQIALNILLFNLVVGSLGCLALVLFPGILLSVFRSAALVPLAPVIGVVILLWIVAASLEMIALARQETRLAASFIVIAQLSRTGLLVAAALLHPSVRSLIYAAVGYGVLQTIILLIYLESRFSGFWCAFDWPLLRAQLAYALPLGAGGVLFALQNDVHNYFVSNKFGPAAFAIYSVGCTQLPFVALLSESVGSVMIARVSVLQKENDPRQIVRLTALAMRRLAAVFFPSYVFLMVVGREVIRLLFTSAYIASWPVFAINLTLVPVAIFVADPIARAYASQRFFLLRLKIFIFCLIWMVLWFGTARLGMVGVAAVVVGANILEQGIAVVRLSRNVGVTRRDLILLRDVGKIALAALGAGLAALPVRYAMADRPAMLMIATAAAVFVPIYIGLVASLNILTPDEHTQVRQGYNRLSRRFFSKDLSRA
jgi:O-antigen/teichoic acid export membrane protein